MCSSDLSRRKSPSSPSPKAKTLFPTRRSSDLARNASRFPLLHAAPRAPAAGGQTFFVSLAGSDANPGTQAAPFRTLGAAVAASRATPGWDTILLRGGTYYSQPTTSLTAADAGLTIQNFPGEEVWLSGAAPLTGITWQPYNVGNASLTWQVFPDTSTVFGGGGFPSQVVDNVADWQSCQALCDANHKSGGPCTTWTWHSPLVEPQYQLQCWLRLDGQWAPTADANHTSGRLAQGPNVWVADLSSAGIAAVPGLRYATGPRLQRAQFPNFDREAKGMMPPGVFRASWTPQQGKRAPDTQIDLPASALDRNSSASMFQVWTAGIGGTCEGQFQPAAGYWCSNAVQGGGSVIYYVPMAMQASTAVLPNSPYANPVGAVVQTWRPGHWASWMYTVGSATWDPASKTTNFSFSAGGFQGSRGEDSGEDTYIENVFEELDAPSEFFFNESTKMLYLFWNASAGVPPPADGSISVTQTASAAEQPLPRRRPGQTLTPKPSPNPIAIRRSGSSTSPAPWPRPSRTSASSASACATRPTLTWTPTRCRAAAIGPSSAALWSSWRAPSA